MNKQQKRKETVLQRRNSTKRKYIERLSTPRAGLVMCGVSLTCPVLTSFCCEIILNKKQTKQQQKHTKQQQTTTHTQKSTKNPNKTTNPQENP